MSIDEAIKHCEEVAETNESQSKWLIYKIQNTEYNEYYKKKYQSCIKHASEHRQLAEWLKALKEIWDSGDCNDCLHSKNCTIRPKLGQMVRYNCYQYEREVNADE